MTAQPYEDRLTRLEGAFIQVADQLTSLDANVAGLRVEMRSGFARIDERFARIDEQFVRIDERFLRVDERFDRMDAKFETKLELVDAKFETKLEIMDAKFDRKLELLDAKIDARHDSLRAEMNDGFVRSDKKIDTLQFEMHATFRTMIGWMAGQTAIIVGSIIAVAFVLHR